MKWKKVGKVIKVYTLTKSKTPPLSSWNRTNFPLPDRDCYVQSVRCTNSEFLFSTNLIKYQRYLKITDKNLEGLFPSAILYRPTETAASILRSSEKKITGTILEVWNSQLKSCPILTQNGIRHLPYGMMIYLGKITLESPPTRRCLRIQGICWYTKYWTMHTDRGRKLLIWNRELGAEVSSKD